MPKGGKRAGAGRRAHVPPLRRYSAYLTEEQARLLRTWGKGDLSAGMRWLVEVAAPMVRRKKEKSEEEDLQ